MTMTMIMIIRPNFYLLSFLAKTKTMTMIIFIVTRCIQYHLLSFIHRSNDSETKHNEKQCESHVPATIIKSTDHNMMKYNEDIIMTMMNMTVMMNMAVMNMTMMITTMMTKMTKMTIEVLRSFLQGVVLLQSHQVAKPWIIVIVMLW